MALGPDELSFLTPPTKVSELGLPEGLVEDLFLRRVFNERLTTVGRAADALAISHAVGDELAERLRGKNLVEYQGADGRDYRVVLTERGHRLTADRMRTARHVAVMPVPLDDYRTLVELQQPEVYLDRSVVKKHFGDMVLEDAVLDQIGPAFLGDGAIFFYGPPGTGKTSLAERMSRFYSDHILIPRFLEADGQLISVFDPSIHKAHTNQPDQLDPRYVLCRRPLVMVGGELTVDMMDLRMDSQSGLTTPSIQLLANNGILVVDDFGRQAPTPEQVLNRWILPMSHGIDHLETGTGTKFTVPFQVKLVISTNLSPRSLGDDAFLRRLRHKIYVGPCSEDAFLWILARSAAGYGVEIPGEAVDHLIAATKQAIGELRPYVAPDFCEMAVGLCNYHGQPAQLSPRLVDRIAAVYFVKDDLEGMSDGRRRRPDDVAPPPSRPAEPVNAFVDGSAFST